ncbi:hypothetical protein D4R87_00405 [bacterium]|nr:MAG: hypothetical protein D4R87_00405 [bacterium]
MRNKIEYKKVTWIDIEKPQPSDIEFLREKFHFNPIDLEEINRMTYRPKADDHGKYIFIVLHFPYYDTNRESTVSSELEIFITKDHLITTHPFPIPPLTSAFEGCRNHTSVAERYMGQATGQLLYHLMERLFDACFPKLDRIAERIDEIEQQIFKGREKEMVKEISLIQREVLSLRRILKPQRSILESLATTDNTEILPKKFQVYFRDIIGSNIRVWNALENHKETVEALKDTNESLLSNKISEIIKVLTVVSFVTFPLSIITGFWGMNVFENVSWINNTIVAPTIFAFMIATTVLMITYFKRKKWL